MFAGLTHRHNTSAAGFLALAGLLGMSLAIPDTARAQDSIQSATQDLDVLLDTPVSAASKYAQDVRQVAGSVTIVSPEDIRRFGYRT